MDKIKKILAKGFFPVQLPPGFSTVTFSNKYKKVALEWEKIKRMPSSKPEKFSVARSSYHRRPTSIVNPIPYYFIAKEISSSWKDIQKHYKKSMLSLSKPTILGSDRAINLRKFGELHEEKIIKSSGYRYALITDITQFFPAIYTHTIPWALHGKSEAKNHRRDKTYLGNKLDKCSMAMQEWQTMGLPIGPDTSHILAEIIGVGIDLKIKEYLGCWPPGYRYVDDFYLFFSTRNEAEAALSKIIKSINFFELHVNANKTKIIKIKQIIDDSWKYSVKQLTISDEKKSQRRDIHKFFENLFQLAEKFGDESVMKYGVRYISTKIVKKSNWDIFEPYLLKTGFSFPNTIQTIAHVLSTYKYHDYELNLSNIERFANSLVIEHAISDHHSEVAWALWILKELSLKLSKESIESLSNINSSVCILIALDIIKSGNSHGTLDKKRLNAFSTKNALYESMWLLAYEGGHKGWIGRNQGYIKGDSFFSHLLSNKISFYDSKAKCTPLFDVKPKLPEKFTIDAISALFDSNKNINNLFDFEDVDDEYFDSDSNSSDSDDENSSDWDLFDFGEES